MWKYLTGLYFASITGVCCHVCISNLALVGKVYTSSLEPQIMFT